MIRDWTDSIRFDGIAPESERLFMRLLMKADDYGRFHADPRLIKAGCFPLIDNLKPVTIEGWLDDLTHRGLILRYRVGERAYLSIIQYGQRLKSSRAKFPPLPGKETDWLPLFEDFPELPGTSRNFPELPARREEKRSGIEGQDEDEDEEENEHEAPKSAGVHALVSAVWSAYPKVGRERSSKADTEEAFRKIPAKDRPTPDDITAAVAKWKLSLSWTDDGGAFVPGVHRWVKARQWENIPDPASTTTKPSRHAGLNTMEITGNEF